MIRRSTESVRNAATRDTPTGSDSTPSNGTRRAFRPFNAHFIAASALLACIGGAALIPGSASADTIASKRAKAASIVSQMQKNGDQISLLDEQYNAALYKVAQLRKEIAVAAQDAVAANGKVAAVQRTLALRAASMYRNAGTDPVATSAGTIQQDGATSVYAQSTAAKDRAMIDSFRQARDAAKAIESRKQHAEHDAQQQAAAASKARNTLAATNRVQAQLLAQTQGELKDLILAEQKRQDAIAEAKAVKLQRDAEAAARRLAQQQQQNNGNNTPGTTPRAGGNSGGSNGGSTTPPPSHIVAPNPNAQLAVNYAMAQMGKPYRFAASGPDYFDCSGLTLMAWAQAGVSMAHFAATQYTSFPHVAISQLQPGDLVFYGSPIHHVGMFIGGGMMVDAPHTGAWVRTASIYRPDYVGASRP